MADASTPPRDSTGAGAFGFGEQTPALPGLSQDCPGGQEGWSQHASSTQLPEMQSAPSLQAPPFGMRVAVGVRGDHAHAEVAELTKDHLGHEKVSGDTVGTLDDKAGAARRRACAARTNDLEAVRCPLNWRDLRQANARRRDGSMRRSIHAAIDPRGLAIRFPAGWSTGVVGKSSWPIRVDRTPRGRLHGGVDGGAMCVLIFARRL